MATRNLMTNLVQSPSASNIAAAVLQCADCGSAEPTWAIMNRGVLVCSECCQVHRSLGRHISCIRSLKRAHWHANQLSLIYMLASGAANSIWEHSLLEGDQDNKYHKPTPRDAVHPTKADFIRAKYAHCLFAVKTAQYNGEDLDRQLWSVVRTAHIETTLRLLVQGADPNNAQQDGSTPLHIAAKEGQKQQVELLYIYNADPAKPDADGKTPAQLASRAGHNDLAYRLTQLEFECTDRLSMFLCGRRSDHQSGHFLIPQMSANTGIDSTAVMLAKRTMQLLPSHLFERLIQDVYDEVDRRENDSAFLAETAPFDANNERFIIPFLPVNSTMSATRNQARQKLAKFGPREFASFIIDVLTEAKRRHTAAHSGSENIEEDVVQSMEQVSLSTADANALLNAVKKRSEKCLSNEDKANKSFDSFLQSPQKATMQNTSVINTNGVASLNIQTDKYAELKEQLNETRKRNEDLENSQKNVLSELRQLTQLVQAMHDDNVQLRMLIAENVKHVAQQRSPQSDSSAKVGIADAVRDLQAAGAHLTEEVNAATPPSKRRLEGIIKRQPAKMTAKLHPPTPMKVTTQVMSRANVDSQENSPSGASSGEYARLSPCPSTQIFAAPSFESRALAESPDGRLAFPDDLVVKTEQLTGSIHRLLAEAQHGNALAFPLVADQMAKVVDDMCAMVPKDHINTGRLKECLSNMCESSVTLTVRCTVAAREYSANGNNAEQSMCTAVQAAYTLAKLAKNLLGIIQETDQLR